MFQTRRLRHREAGRGRGLRRPEDQRLQLHDPHLQQRQAAVRRRPGSPGRGLRDRQGPHQRAGLRRRPRAELLGLRRSTRRTTTRTPRRRSTTRRRPPSSSTSSAASTSPRLHPHPGGREILNIIKHLGEDVGMNITLKSQEQGAYVNRMFSQGRRLRGRLLPQQPLHRARRDPARASPPTTPATSPSTATPRSTQLLDEARQTADFEERKEKYYEVQEITGRRGAVPHHAVRPVRQRLRRHAGSVRRLPVSRTRSGAIKPGFLYARGLTAPAVRLTPPGREDLNHHAHSHAACSRSSRSCSVSS